MRTMTPRKFVTIELTPHESVTMRLNEIHGLVRNLNIITVYVASFFLQINSDTEETAIRREAYLLEQITHDSEKPLN